MASQHDPATLMSTISDRLRHDREVVLAIVRRGGRALQHASEALRLNDYEIVQAAVLSDPCALEKTSMESRNRRDLIESVLRKHGNNDKATLSSVNPFRNPYRASLALKFASPELQNNTDLVSMALEYSGGKAWPFASVRCRKDVGLFEKALEYSIAAATPAMKHSSRHAGGCAAEILQRASAEIQANPTLVTRAVQHDGLALQYAAPALQGNASIARFAVQEHGHALQFVRNVAQLLPKDPDLLLCAVKTTPTALQFLSPEARDDQDIVTTAIRQENGGNALLYASERLQNDPLLVLLAMDHGFHLRNATPAIKRNGAVVLHAMQLMANDNIYNEYPEGLQPGWFAPDLLEDAEFMLAAVQIDAYILQFASPEIRNDFNVVLAAVSSPLFEPDGEIVVALEFASETLRANKDIALAAMRRGTTYTNQEYCLLLYVSPELRRDRDVVLAAVQDLASNLAFADSVLRNDVEIVVHALREPLSCARAIWCCHVGVDLIKQLYAVISVALEKLRREEPAADAFDTSSQFARQWERETWGKFFLVSQLGSATAGDWSSSLHLPKLVQRQIAEYSFARDMTHCRAILRYEIILTEYAQMFGVSWYRGFELFVEHHQPVKAKDMDVVGVDPILTG